MKIPDLKVLPKWRIMKIISQSLSMILVLMLFLFAASAPAFSQNTGVSGEKVVTGTVTDINGEPMTGVSVIVKGTTVGAITNAEGNFRLNIPENAEALKFSFIGMTSQELPVGDRTIFDVVMEEESFGLDEVVVVGYGTQKKSDITGTVASLGKEHLDMGPNLSVAEAIKGAIPGVMIQTSAAGANPDQSILVRGRTSIIVIDGVPYGGQISDVNPTDVESIEILKDASAAAIYGSRGSNGVILITTKVGNTGKPVFRYDVKYSMQSPTNLPQTMDGGEFYDFKMIRGPEYMTEHEIMNYEAGNWVDWYDLALRNGRSQDHNLSISGGTENIKYYVSGNLLDVKGIALKDDFLRASSRINLDIELTEWLSFGTRTQLSYIDESGIPADFEEITKANPLVTPFDEDGNLTIYPWPGNEDLYNALESTIWDNKDLGYQVITNNYALVKIPFIPGLSYRLNTGIKLSLSDEATYQGKNSSTGYKLEGGSETERNISNGSTIENIFSYVGEFGVHKIFATGLIGYEKEKYESTAISAQGFPHDFLTQYSIGQAEFIQPEYLFRSSSLISQMLRINYSYDSRYLFTATGRRDGFSGFGANSKWGLFPSLALGWNIANEDFFPWTELFNELKLRASYGVNGNQAVGPYQAISRLKPINIINGNTTLPGYEPSVLAIDNLGWESSRTLNLGLDFGMKNNRFTGNLNVYKTNTSDLLLNRTISGVHGITFITQNIGKTANTGIEFSVISRNISTPDFQWVTSGNLSFVKNEIVSLYGDLDEEGEEIDDLVNAWFIGEPIRVIYDFRWVETWQEDEAEEAAKYGSVPGDVKLKDVNMDYLIDAEDREIIGQRDPNFLWGLNNTFSYKNFSLNVFIHGVHGVTKRNRLMSDNTHSEIRRNTIKKDWWTPDNPTNNWVRNDFRAEYMGGQQGILYTNASFIRIKDVSASYNFSNDLIRKIGLNRLRLYVTGRNLLTISKWENGMDPELDDQRDIPYQKEIVFGLNLEF